MNIQLFDIREHPNMTSDDFWSSTYPDQMIYYISLFSKIRWSVTYLPTLKSDVICGCLYPKKFTRYYKKITRWALESTHTRKSSIRSIKK